MVIIRSEKITDTTPRLRILLENNDSRLKVDSYNTGWIGRRNSCKSTERNKISVSVMTDSKERQMA